MARVWCTRYGRVRRGTRSPRPTAPAGGGWASGTWSTPTCRCGPASAGGCGAGGRSGSACWTVGANSGRWSSRRTAATFLSCFAFGTRTATGPRHCPAAIRLLASTVLPTPLWSIGLSQGGVRVAGAVPAVAGHPRPRPLPRVAPGVRPASAGVPVVAADGARAVGHGQADAEEVALDRGEASAPRQGVP